MALFKGGADRRIGMWGWDMAQNAIGAGQGIIDAARNPALAALGEGRTQGLNALGQGYGQARDDLGAQFTGAIDRLQPYNQAGLDALGMERNSLGLGGAAGNAAATAAFQESPGYRYQVDQATDAVARKASALGSLGSGNTQAAITDRASQLANQEYGGWQDRLSNLGQRGQQAAGMQAGLQGQYGQSLANLGQSQGRDIASLWSDTAGREAGVHTGLAGLGMNNLWQGTNAGIGAVTQAQQQAKGNVMSGLNFGINALGTGVNLLGLGMGGGNTLGGNMLNWARGK